MKRPWGAVGLIVLTIGYILYDAQLTFTRDRALALGLILALNKAETREVPGLIDFIENKSQVGPLVRDELRKEMDQCCPPGDKDHLRQCLHAALALLTTDPTQNYLVERLLRDDTRPDELFVIRKMLHDHCHDPALTPNLRALLAGTPDELTDSQLRATGALAVFAPKDPHFWLALGPRVAAKLVRENSLLIGTWREVFQTVAPALTPPLRQHFADRNQPEQGVAFTLLFEFAKNSGLTIRVGRLRTWSN